MAGDDQQGLLPQTAPGGAPAGAQRKVPPILANVKMNYVWFGAACAVTLGAAIGTLAFLLTEVKPVSLIGQLYQLIFGLVMVVLDLPMSEKWTANESKRTTLIKEAKKFIYKYMQFLTRLTGRGVWFIFLGCMTFATLWDSNISAFLAVVLGFPVFVVGVFSLVFGVIKSYKLDRVRQQCSNMNKEGKLRGVFEAFAKMSSEKEYKDQGLTAAEFGELVTTLSKIFFEPDELAFMVPALASNGRLISFEDLDQFATGGMVYL